MKSRKSFLLRLDPDLHTALEAWAQQEMRSVNGQVEFILRQAVMARRKTPTSDNEATQPLPSEKDNLEKEKPSDKETNSN